MAKIFDVTYVVETSVSGASNSRDIADEYGENASKWWAMSDSSPWRLLKVKGLNVLVVVKALMQRNYPIRVKDFETAEELVDLRFDPLEAGEEAGLSVNVMEESDIYKILSKLKKH